MLHNIWRISVTPVCLERGVAELPASRFDRIHLSNVPDYLGMSFFNHVYAASLLKKHDEAFFTFNCLVCPPYWRSAADWDYGSVCLRNPKQLEAALDVRFDGYIDDYQRPQMFYLGLYWRWKAVRKRSENVETLLPKATLVRWLYAMFLHIALPAPRGEGEELGYPMPVRVHKPLNLTAFLRLLLHLKSIGYSSHWLGTVLENILMDNVVTSARAPTECPSQVDQLSSKAAPQKISMVPFIAELSTIAAQFANVLPFATTIDSEIFPRQESVRECTLTWTTPPYEDDLFHEDANRADWILVFAQIASLHKAERKVKSLEHIDPHRLRTFRDMVDETEKIHIVTTWKWNRELNKGRFWMREDVLDQIHRNGEEYRVEIYRTDAWDALGKRPFESRPDLKVGRRWSDVVKECGGPETAKVVDGGLVWENAGDLD
jgi:hypothetical protein